MRDIEELWIINPYGITLFNISKEETVDAALFGGFFTAIQNFISSLGEKELKALELGESKLTIYHGNQDFLFVSRSKKSIKNKRIEEHLKLVEKEFFEAFGDILKIWNGNTALFKDFEQRIEEIFKDTPEKRAEKALW
ncbi:MAG: hypothetical protein ACFFCM_19450 [Promethearchaeota archaeon]